MKTITRDGVILEDASNAVRPEDREVHDWYRFVLSFPPHLVRHYLERFAVRHDSVILDPFCGTGTTLVEAKKQGFPSFGVEPSPMAFLASRVKTDWSVDPSTLRDLADGVYRSARRMFSRTGVSDVVGESSSSANLVSLPSAAEALLISGSISPLPLHKVLLLERVIARQPAPFRDVFRLALAKVLPTEIGNLKFGPEVGVGRRKEDASVLGPWLEAVTSMSADLEGMTSTAPTTVLQADARALPIEIGPRTVDLVITSPPYPNEKDYTRTTRLEAVVLGLYQDKHDLQALKRGMLLRSNSRTIYKGDTDLDWVRENPEIVHLANEIENRRLELGKTSGFEKNYRKVVLSYFGGMRRHLESLAESLTPGAHVAMVVGDQASFFRIMIRTGHLLASLAEQIGYEVEAIDLFRTRLATATGEQLREEVLVLRWPR